MSSVSNEYNEALLEPLKYYREDLKDAFQHVTEEYFQDLVNQSKVDIDKNRELIDKYTTVSENRDQSNTSYKRFGIIKKIDFVFGIGALIYGVYQFSQDPIDIISVAVSSIVLVLTVVLYLYWIKPNSKSLEEKLNDLESTLAQMRQEGYEMLAPLNNLFHSEMTAELIKKAIPFIHMDSNFNIERYEQLVKDYGFLEKGDVNHSTLDIASGDILGNPFVFLKRIIHWMDDYTYEGTLNVTYTEEYVDSNGNLKTRDVNETLRAVIRQPGPYYANRVSLVYGNHAAPNLIFHRKPPEKGFFNLGGAKSLLSKGIASIRKKGQDSLEGGGSFQALANEEFDAQFNALDRNNEVEFRVLFTPLAQNNYKDIFENSPYGDDFVFNKECKINEIKTDNSQKWDFNTAPSQYYDFSFQKIKEKFINFNCAYFDHMYFSFLPVLAIPVYQQMASNDYIYGKSYDFRYNDYITEMLANKMGLNLFVPPDAAERNNVKTILKTSHHKKEGDSEVIKVDAYSYRTIGHVDEVPVRAGNGRTYYVPVHWEEYVPVTKHEFIEVSEIQSAGDDFKHIKGLDHYQQSENNKDRSFAYDHFMVGKLYRQNQSLSDLLHTVYEQFGGSNNG